MFQSGKLSFIGCVCRAEKCRTLKIEKLTCRYSHVSCHHEGYREMCNMTVVAIRVTLKES